MIRVTNFFDKYSEIAFDMGILTHGIIFMLSNIYGSDFSEVGLYWFLIIWALALYLLSIESRNKNWFRSAFFWMAIYNIIDCIKGGGLTLQYYELALFLGISLYSYFKYKHNWTP